MRPAEIHDDGKPPSESSEPRIRRIRIEGEVPLESYGELFRCFVGPAARMKLKRLKLGIRFALEAPDNDPMDPNDSSLKAMREAARQLGLTLEVDE
jgi:hypothetical protein